MFVSYCGGNLTPSGRGGGKFGRGGGKFGRGGGKFEPGVSKSLYSSVTLWLIKIGLQRFLFLVKRGMQ